MRIIYIRHAEKDFQNGDSIYFKHDPGITALGVERTRIIFQKLINLYGEPNQIISSPYRRARETSLILNNCLKTPLEEIEIDPEVSEYLGNHNNVDLDVTTATRIHDPPHPETFDQMKKRVKKHVEKIKKRINNENEKNEKKIIWIVTHGLIIKQIADIIGIKPSNELPYLTCFSVLEEEDFLIRAEFLLFFSKQENNLTPRTPKTSKMITKNRYSDRNDKKQFERFLITPKLDYNGRDDMSGVNCQKTLNKI